jgi:DNA-binding response OmpR family regulator
MKVLIAEDDPNTREGLKEILSSEGYEVFTAADGVAAVRIFEREAPQIVCLDIMMPEMSGYDVCRQIRKTDPVAGVIFISAKSEEIDTVLGLELGADDFIVKPFGIKSVVARIRAVTRRVMLSRASKQSKSSEEHFQMADVTIKADELRAYRGGAAMELNIRDLKILRLLYENRGKAVDRDQLFAKCWGYDFMPNSRCLDQHVSQLRKRIEIDHRDPTIIRTVHGVGYRYDG